MSGFADRVVAPPGSGPTWRDRFWFPVASPFELDPKRPTPVVIDGLALVVWHRSAGLKGKAVDDAGWRVFADVCPHRLAPLSEGRIEPSTGCIQCAYHGWEFDGDGKCTSIPSTDIESCSRACSLKRSEALNYPCEVAFGVIWAWLGSEAPVGTPSKMLDGAPVEPFSVYKTYTRDLPYGYDTLVENLLDVSHIPFAHHGLQGTRKDATPITLQVDSSRKDDALAFSFEDRTMGMNRQCDFFMKLPFLAFYRGKFDSPKRKNPFKLSFLCIPQAPGKSRLILLHTDPPSRGLKGAIFSLFPVWVIHVFSGVFLDSDLAFLHFQERTLRAPPRSADKWSSAYFMPAACDKSISAWRRWLEREGARCVTEQLELPETPPRHVLLDRYEQHTKHCRHCLAALEGLTIWQWRLGKLGVLALTLDRLGLGPTRIWLACQVFALGSIATLQSLRPHFHFVDYKHYLK